MRVGRLQPVALGPQVLGLRSSCSCSWRGCDPPGEGPPRGTTLPADVSEPLTAWQEVQAFGTAVWDAAAERLPPQRGQGRDLAVGVGSTPCRQPRSGGPPCGAHRRSDVLSPAIREAFGKSFSRSLPALCICSSRHLNETPGCSC